MKKIAKSNAFLKKKRSEFNYKNFNFGWRVSSMSFYTPFSSINNYKSIK